MPDIPSREGNGLLMLTALVIVCIVLEYVFTNIAYGSNQQGEWEIAGLFSMILAIVFFLWRIS